MAMDSVSSAVEDYAKAIYALETRGEGAAVSTNAIAERLGVTAASASNMVKKLDTLGLVRHVPYRGVQLTPDGVKVALEVIRHHHERWDGKGYPDRLVGTQIPLLARILAVADVYDALTSERAYRPAWSPEEARRHVREESGKAFDPQVVEAALAVLAEAPTDVPARQRERRLTLVGTD